MRDGTNGEQLILFRNRVAWQELPREIRDQTIDLITTLCVAIVMEAPPLIQEQDDESAH